MFLFGELINSSLAKLFLCQPFDFPSVHLFGRSFLCRQLKFSILWLVDFVPTIQLSTCSSLGQVIFVLTIQFSIFGELFSCRPFNCQSVHPSGGYFFVVHPLPSYFHADHITLHPSIPWVSYFRAVHPLGELFSCLPFSSPSFGELFSSRPYNSPSVHSFGELFSCRISNSSSFHLFGELFLSNV